MQTPFGMVNRASILACLLLVACSIASAKTHEIQPQGYSDTFSADKKPILEIQSGDTVSASTWDALGRDKNDVAHIPDPFGFPELSNPLLGPFYVQDSNYGDVLEVHLDTVRLNRNWGYTNYRLLTTIITPGMVESLYKDYYKADAVWPGRANMIPWDLDLRRGVANPRLLQSSGMKFDLPIRPMLGCIGVAAPGENVGTADISGSWGGNMDYNDVVEGATLYFPVYHKGAYLYIGDGHALQGDGEGLGMGIETSLDVQFTVRVLKRVRIGTPRLINDDYIVAIASQPEYRSNLDLGIQEANSEMINWLISEYKLTPPEAHLLLGMEVRHKIVTYFGTVTAMIPRRCLPHH
jgi:acetamidase/formamidase